MAAGRLRLVFIGACLPWLALLALLASLGWFTVDDAYISFRYARNLLEGHGLVFNPGEYVEGYSNFLWVLELAALWRLTGVPPEVYAPWLSVLCTAATIATVLWWTFRLPGLKARRLTAWMALGFLCASAAFGVWTSAGGLETRQFTLFVVLAVALTSARPHSRGALFLASTSLGLAALTRPEGPLFALCCFAWFGAQRLVADDRRLDWRDAACLVAPCLLIVVAHYLFRHAYYGEWLPNTYYAKHVRPWYGRGLPYLAMAALETGLHLLLGLALLALAGNRRLMRWLAFHRRSRAAHRGRLRSDDIAFALPLLCVVVHLAYVARIGGDHLHLRPLDVYWPLLAVPAAAGIVKLGAWLKAILPRWRLRSSTWALVVFALALAQANALQTVALLGGIYLQDAVRANLPAAPAAWAVSKLPGLATLTALHARIGALMRDKTWQHASWAKRRIGYADVPRGVIPEDALALVRPAGRLPYALADLRFVDYYGLTDKTIARNPVATGNEDRIWGHNRTPAPGYLQRRGVNFVVGRAATNEEEALRNGTYAVALRPGLWMPFDAPSLAWVAQRFPRFSYNRDADDELAGMVDEARLLYRGPFDIFLRNGRLLYVKQRCSAFEPMVFVHVQPVDPAHLPASSRRDGFENLDFRLVDDGWHWGRQRLGAVHRCAAVRLLPDYPIAVVRTGQFEGIGRGRYHRFWEHELRLDAAPRDAQTNVP